VAQSSAGCRRRVPRKSPSCELRCGGFAVTSVSGDRARPLSRNGRRALALALALWAAARDQGGMGCAALCALREACCTLHAPRCMLDVGCWMLRAPAAQGGGDALPRAITHRARLVLRDGARVVSECADRHIIQNAPHVQHTTWHMHHTCSIHRRSIKSTVPQRVNAHSTVRDYAPLELRSE
jgi:hypothetical protein